MSAEDATGGSNFNVLATGTQDLAALVGIFAADSVEPYAFNYSRGWLSPLASTLSLLGVLGYIRGLVKLGLGREGCLRAKFDIKAERTFFGFLDEDWLPPGAVHQVTYLQRERHEDHVVWSTNRRIKHTSESMPILRIALSGPFANHGNVVVNTCQIQYKIKHFRSGYGHIIVPLVSVIFVGVTTLTIIPLRSHPRSMSWTWYFATVGMFTSLFASFMLWSWVYAQEMLPHHQSNWADQTVTNRFRQRPSLEKRDYFAFVQIGPRFVTFDLRAIKGDTRWLVRATSLGMAVLGLFSYICQYIELRGTSSHHSAIWLGVQGVLALARVGIWVLDPGFDDLEAGSDDAQTWHTEPIISMSEEKLLLLRLSHLNEPSLTTDTLTLSRTPAPLKPITPAPRTHHSDPLAIPIWVLPVLDLPEPLLARAFELAYSLYSEPANTPSRASALDLFRNVRRAWDFPLGFLTWWVEAHNARSFDTDLDVGSYGSLTKNAIGCRVVEDQYGRCHYLPYVQRGERGEQVFGDPRAEQKTMYTTAPPDATTTETLSAHRDGMRVGWPVKLEHTDSMGMGTGAEVKRKGTGLSLSKINTRTTEMVSEVVSMWDDLIGILRREKTVVFRRQADFLREGAVVGLAKADAEKEGLQDFEA
ncbi:MAG: hypothetical protein OHK93_001640 [Ramalina farinacea]|uniref:Uncharacterized protein n=1 Tax=Ramalina farinacea TaxID=258253 RepID=A0AA43QPY9_9LECA|nr:hypothetical protein [Ramalina farinacea]